MPTGTKNLIPRRRINILRRRIITILFFTLASLSTTPVRAQAKDDTTSKLLQKVRITFNQNNEQEFYSAVSKKG